MADTHETTDNPTLFENEIITKQPLTPADRIEIGRQAVQANKNDGTSFSQFARDHKIEPKTLGYYVTVYRKSIGEHKPQPRSRKKQVTIQQDPRIPAIQTLPALTKQIENTQDELIKNLKAQNEILKKKIKALQHIVLVLGHQLTDEDDE